MVLTEWVVTRTNQEYLNYISKSFGISLPIAQVIVSRGIKDTVDIHDFLKPSFDNVDPFEISGVYQAAKIISEAIKGRKRIMISGDYDADGITATAILYDLLLSKGADVFYYIPHRLEHGFGFNPYSIEFAKRGGAQLIITVDCGIRDFEIVRRAKEEGIDVIITDHHEPLSVGDEVVVPEALAVINPKIDQNHRYRYLAGVGVALMLAMALDRERALDYLDIACLGTFADMVPLTYVNRAIAKYGLSMLATRERLCVKVLKNLSGISTNNLKSHHLSFCLIPRINAPGRVDHAQDVVKFLISKDESEVEELGKWINRLNSQRQQVEERIIEKIEQKLLSEFNDEPVIVLWGDWHLGVVGTVASKLAERFSRPAIVLSLDGELAKGSARAPSGFDLQSMLGFCSDLLLRFGGHRQAAGLALRRELLSAFKERICQALTEPERVRKVTLQLDAAITFSDINERLVDEIRMLEPFGEGNREPLFGSKEITVVNFRRVNSNAVKMFLRQNGCTIGAFGFDFDGFEIEEGSLIDAAYIPVINEWEGLRSLQLQLKHIRRTTR